MKRLVYIIVICQLLNVSLLFSENYQGGTKGSGTLKHWPSNSIYYRVHESGAGDNNLDFASTFNLIQAAYSVWNNVSSSTISFSPDGNGSVSGSESCDDGINGHYWVYPPHYSFQSIFWDNPDTPEIEGASALTIVEDTDDIITDVDILYNGNKEWKGTDYLTWWNEVESVAIHEIGHSFGLDHADAGMSPQPVMTYSAYPSSDRRALKFDDEKGASFLYGGNLIDDETFSGTNYFNWSITVIPGKTLTFQAGSTINFGANTSLIINGTLSAQGTSSNLITISSVTWNGIRFNSGSSGNLQYCDIGYASYGIYCNGYLPNIEHCNLTYNTYGIYAQNVGTTNNNVSYNTISNNTSAGISLYNSSPTIRNSTIDYNGIGVYGDYYSSPVMVCNNIRYNNSYGIRCNSFSSPNMTDNGYPGSNVVRNNYTGINTTYFCNPNLNGYMSYGNSIFDNTGDEVSAYYNCSISAQRVYWGSSPTYYAYQSTIDYSNPLTSNPNSGRSIELLPKEKISSINGINLSIQEDDLSSALDKQRNKKYDEAIPLFLEVFKSNKDALVGKYALIKIEECFTQAGKKDFLEYSNKELRPLIQTSDETFVVLLELETHQQVNAGSYKEAMDNLFLIKDSYNLSKEINKNTLYKIGVFYSQLFGDKNNAQKYFDELKIKYPGDDLVNNIDHWINTTNHESKNGKYIVAEQPRGDNSVSRNASFSIENYPNPFNPTTIISFSIPQKNQIKLKVFDVLGREVANLADGVYEVGKYEVTFDASKLPSGVYFYNLTTGNNSISKKMLLVK